MHSAHGPGAFAEKGMKGTADGRGPGGREGGALLCIGLPPGARKKVERFYDQIDRDLAAEERERRRRAKKARRKAKRRLKRLLKAATACGDPKRRAEAGERIIDLFAGREVGHA